MVKCKSNHDVNNTMIDIENTLHNFQISLCKKVSFGGLIGRSKVAHKWKLTYRLLVLREGLGWRLVDILSQAYKLGQDNMIIGARILTRSALETLCLLIYMNHQMEIVTENILSFNDFEKNTSKMLLGTKNIEKSPTPINVNGLIEESDKKYDGLKDIYDDLSETVHPNYEGITVGYSNLNREENFTEFGNFVEDKFGKQHEIAIQLSLEIFENEYNNIWPERFEKLEKWLEDNDNKLERQRRKKLKNI